MQCCQLFFVCLGGGPGREQKLHPAFVLQSPQHLQPLFLMANLLKLLAACLCGEILDHALALGILIPSEGFGVEFPSQPRNVPRGANQQRRLLKKTII